MPLHRAFEKLEAADRFTRLRRRWNLHGFVDHDRFRVSPRLAGLKYSPIRRQRSILCGPLREDLSHSEVDWFGAKRCKHVSKSPHIGERVEGILGQDQSSRTHTSHSRLSAGLACRATGPGDARPRAIEQERATGRTSVSGNGSSTAEASAAAYGDLFKAEVQNTQDGRVIEPSQDAQPPKERRFWLADLKLLAVNLGTEGRPDWRWFQRRDEPKATVNIVRLSRECSNRTYVMFQWHIPVSLLLLEQVT